ncbi:MAG: hypothetical protein WB462_05905 [Solirubrobacterales bacterium]
MTYPDRSTSTDRTHGSRYWGRADGTLDRLLLVLGAIALIGLVPVLWIWLLYGSGLGSAAVSGGGIALCGVTAVIGFAMLRLLDGRR